MSKYTLYFTVPNENTPTYCGSLQQEVARVFFKWDPESNRPTPARLLHDSDEEDTPVAAVDRKVPAVADDQKVPTTADNRKVPAFGGLLRGLFGIGGGAPPPVPAAVPPMAPLTAAPNIEDLNDAGCWDEVGKIQWVFRSERVITSRSLDRLVEDLKEDKKLPVIRQSFQRLIAAFRLAYPPFASLTANEIAQVIAFGREMSMAAGADSDLLAYAKSEMQAVDLAVKIALM